MAASRREEARGEQSEDQKRGDRRELTRQTAPPRRTARKRGGGCQYKDECGDSCAPSRGGAVAEERRRARRRDGGCQYEDECGGSCATCLGGAVRRRENQRALRGACGECSACVGSGERRKGENKGEGRRQLRAYGPTTVKNL